MFTKLDIIKCLSNGWLKIMTLITNILFYKFYFIVFILFIIILNKDEIKYNTVLYKK